MTSLKRHFVTTFISVKLRCPRWRLPLCIDLIDTHRCRICKCISARFVRHKLATVHSHVPSIHLATHSLTAQSDDHYSCYCVCIRTMTQRAIDADSSWFLRLVLPTVVTDKTVDNQSVKLLESTWRRCSWWAALNSSVFNLLLNVLSSSVCLQLSETERQFVGARWRKKLSATTQCGWR